MHGEILLDSVGPERLAEVDDDEAAHERDGHHVGGHPHSKTAFHVFHFDLAEKKKLNITKCHASTCSVEFFLHSSYSSL